MKAIQISRFGGPEVLELVDCPTPSPSAGQVLIRVAVAGVNFAETLMREDSYIASYTLPAVPGSELVGTIAALGPGVEGLAVGERVGAVLPAVRVLTGGYAEYAVADIAAVAPIPDGLAFEAAAALLVQGLTALYLVREVDPRGRRVLITAAGGGVGSLLVQLARHAGATHVIAVASNAEKRALALSLGADTAVGYEDWSGLSPDLIYDSVGGALFPTCLAALAPGGGLVAYGSLNLQNFVMGVAELRRLVFGNQTLRGFAFGPLLQKGDMRRDLAELFDLALRGVIAPAIGAIFPLEQAIVAHQMLAGRSSKGKLLLAPAK